MQVQKISILPPQKGLEFPGGGGGGEGFCKTMYEAYSVGEVWILSGTTR